MGTVVSINSRKLSASITGDLQVGDFVEVVPKFPHYAKSWFGRVVAVVHLGEVPDAELMERLFAKQIERRGGRANLGIPTKPSSYSRIIVEARAGIVRAFAMDSNHHVYNYGQKPTPQKV